METLKEFDDLIKSISGGDMLLERQEGPQQWRYEFRPSANTRARLRVQLRLFPHPPAKPTSIVSKVGLSIGANRSREQDRQTTSRAYFGRAFDELCKLSKSCFGAEAGEFQITCENKRLLTGFVGVVITWRREGMLTNG